MQSDAVLHRLRAWHDGKPLARYSTIHVPVADAKDLLVLSFVRMGGESAPWGIAVGHRGGPPRIFTVPEARNRDLVAEMVARFAPVLLEHFRHPGYGEEVTGPEHDLPLRQLWLPNGTHLDMLHALAYAYTFTKWGPPERARTLNALGRLCGWLFREAQRPGEVSIISATDALRSAYTFPADGVRQSHLGFLLAWLRTNGRRDRRLAAAQEAEQRSVSTSLDPTIERDGLAPRVERWNEAHNTGDARKMEREAAAIARMLGAELRHRYDLTQRAIDVIADNRRRYNAGLPLLEAEAKREHWYQYVRMELRRDDEEDGPAFTPSPETDRHPAAAAARYFVHAASEDHRLSALVHDDEELQSELVSEGKALRGTITAVRDEGTGRRTIPVWELETPDDAPLSIRVGTDLCVAGLPKRVLRVREIDRKKSGRLSIELEVTKLVTVPHGSTGVRAASDPWHKGKRVTLLPTSKDSIPRLKSWKVWRHDAPGAWLTHASPAGNRANLPEEVREDLDSIASEQAVP